MDWSYEDDILLAECVLRHVREGSTMINGFDEASQRMNRTASECGYRWNAVVRHSYHGAMALAKKQRYELKRRLKDGKA